MYNKFIPNFLTEEECDKIIELGKQTDLQGEISNIQRW